MFYAHEQKEKKRIYVGPRPGFPEPSEALMDRMNAYLVERNLSPALAQGNGWYPSRYQFAPRIVIPCSNSAGVPYFQARDIGGKAKLRYASPPASRDDSLVVVWPVGNAIGTVVVEGPMCALAAAAEKYVGIALMGNQPTPEVFAHLYSFARAFQPVLIVPDMDTMELGPVVLCALGQRGIICRVMETPIKDLAEMTPLQRKKFLHGK